MPNYCTPRLDFSTDALSVTTPSWVAVTWRVGQAGYSELGQTTILG